MKAKRKAPPKQTQEKSKIAQLLEQKEVATKDRLGAYPSNVHVPAIVERRYLKTSRILTVTAMISTCVSIIIAFVLYMMAPDKSAIPRFYFIDDKFHTIEEAQRPTAILDPIDSLYEMLIESYIIMRNRIIPDIDIMNRRWGLNGDLALFSLPAVRIAFTEKEMPYYMKTKVARGISRDVKVTVTKRLNYERTFWVSEYETVEMQRNKVIKRSKWRAYLQVAFYSGMAYTSPDQKWRNPFRFQVLFYQVVNIPTEAIPENESK